MQNGTATTSTVSRNKVDNFHLKKKSRGKKFLLETIAKSKIKTWTVLPYRTSLPALRNSQMQIPGNMSNYIASLIFNVVRQAFEECQRDFSSTSFSRKVFRL